MNATAAIAKELLAGRVLSIKTAFNKFGITNLPREASRLIEKRFGVQLTRVRRKGKSRYGIPVSWFEYRLPTTDYNQEGIKRMKEYVAKFYEDQNKSSDTSFKDKNQLGLQF